MAAFDPSAELSHELDYQLVHNTFVTMFWDPKILDGTLSWLVERRYDVVEIDASACTDAGSLLDSIADSFDFPDYFGRNLNALNDCLRDVATGEYGSDPAATGLVLVMRNYDVFASIDASAAHGVLDIYASQARTAALFGRRMMCLVQTDDPRLVFPPIAATPVTWNDAEWLDSKGGPCRHDRGTGCSARQALGLVVRSSPRPLRSSLRQRWLARLTLHTQAPNRCSSPVSGSGRYSGGKPGQTPATRW
jgi:hypothetical protein